MNNKVKCKYITNKLLIEDNKCISVVSNIIYKNNKNIHINHYIVCNHNKICPNKRTPSPEKIKSKRLDDKQKENIIRGEMNKNKSISSNELRKIVGFSADIVNRLYMKVRRKNSIKPNISE